MNLYLLHQSVNDNYDTYDSCLVAAESSDEAVKIHPSGNELKPDGNFKGDVWAYNPSQVECELIGTAKPFTQQGVILASFNAG